MNDSIIPSPDPARRLMILTGPVAPYRLELYHWTAKHLPGWETHLVYGREHQPDHPWVDMFGAGRAYQIHLARGRDVPRWVTSVLRLLHVGNGRPFLPGREVSEALDAIKPDLLWISEISPYTLTGLHWARRHGVPAVLATELGRRTPRDICPALTRGEHRLFGTWMQGIIAHAPAAREPLCPSVARICYAPHAVDAASFPAPRVEPTPGSACRFLFTGQLVRRKGIDALLRAAALLRRESRAEFEIRLLGAGDQEWVESVAAETGTSGVVRFAGFKEGRALAEEYAAADVFVLPSRSDTWGAVVHEAAVSGLPLLVSCHAGAAETLLAAGRNGWLIDPADPAEMAARMRCLLDDPGLRAKMGAESRNIGLEWDVRASGRKVAGFLLGLV